MTVLRGYSAACLLADVHTKTAPSKELVVDKYRRILWETASEEQRKKLLWVTHGKDGPKTAHLPLTPQEKEQLKLNEQYHFKEMYKYLLKNYGWEYADRFYQDKKLTFEKEQYPRCKLKDEKSQCNLFCSFFNNQCTYEEEIE